MAKSDKKRKQQVFEREYEHLREAKETLSKLKEDALSSEQLTISYQELTESYERLLDDSRLMTSVSDRLQNKLNRANDEIQAKNAELRKTIELLTAARAGRKAAMYALGLAIVLFIISEMVIEPKIDEWVASYNEDHSYDFWVSLFFKGLIAVLIKPLEGMIERFLVQQEIKKHQQEAASE
mgnify:CR=1 FL=1